MATVTVPELEAQLKELKEEAREIDADFAGEMLPEHAKERWNQLNEEIERVEAHIKELVAREDRLKSLFDEKRTEGETPVARTGRRVTSSRVPDDPSDLSEYRKLSTNFEDLQQAYRDGAMKLVEKLRPDHPDADREKTQHEVARMLDTIDRTPGEDGQPRALARRIIATTSPVYERAFGKYLVGAHRTSEEERAMSLTTTAGGFAVPVTLDPTVILTSNGVVNPLRAISRREQITGNIWYGVSSTGVSMAYSAEATETSDNAATLAQPTLNVEKAQAFIPYSIEIGEDWGSLQSEMARLLQDGKDSLESTKFLSGAGHGSQEPQGLLVGGTAIVATAATTTFAVADLYSLEEALAPRWRPRASILANKKYLNKVRQFDTAGGASLWVQLGDGTPSRLLDYATYEYSAMTTAATSNASIVTIGDFSMYLIVDKIGLNVEVIPHLFATANNRPSGQRGLYAYFRNSAIVLDQVAFKTLKLL